MEIVTTARELMARSVWMQACELLHIGEWAVNEGQLDWNDELRLTEEQAQELGLLPRA